MFPPTSFPGVPVVSASGHHQVQVSTGMAVEESQQRCSIDIVWFKRDLRIHDHAPLVAALEARRGAGAGGQAFVQSSVLQSSSNPHSCNFSIDASILPIYILEPELWRLPDMSHRHYLFLEESVSELARDLKEHLGLTLHVFVGEAVDVLDEVWTQLSSTSSRTVFTLRSHQETWNWWTYQRDRAVRRWCRSRNIAWREPRQTGVVRRLKDRNGWSRQWETFMRSAQPDIKSHMLVTQWTTDNVNVEGVDQKQCSQSSYQSVQEHVDFVLSSRRCKTRYFGEEEPSSSSSDHNNKATRQQLKMSKALPHPSRFGLEFDGCKGRQRGGRRNGVFMLRSFLDGRGCGYSKNVSSPITAWEGCARLSVHLAFGTVSLREVFQATEKAREKSQALKKEKAGNSRGTKGAAKAKAGSGTGATNSFSSSTSSTSIPTATTALVVGASSTSSTTSKTTPTAPANPPPLTTVLNGRDLNSFGSRLRWHCHFGQKLEDEPLLEFQNLHSGYDGLREENAISDEQAKSVSEWACATCNMNAVVSSGGGEALTRQEHHLLEGYEHCEALARHQEHHLLEGYEHWIQKRRKSSSGQFSVVSPGEIPEERIGLVKFQHWASGTTGYPMIDGCMRALIETGWVNFRMRAMLVSFACFHLWLHWRPVSIHLARLFTDYEPGIHYPQCQMQAGTTGINTIRCYNPIKQSEDQDPDGRFLKRWLPEVFLGGEHINRKDRDIRRERRPALDDKVQVESTKTKPSTCSSMAIPPVAVLETQTTAKVDYFVPRSTGQTAFVTGTTRSVHSPWLRNDFQPPRAAQFWIDDKELKKVIAAEKKKMKQTVAAKAKAAGGKKGGQKSILEMFSAAHDESQKQNGNEEDEEPLCDLDKEDDDAGGDAMSMDTTSKSQPRSSTIAPPPAQPAHLTASQLVLLKRLKKIMDEQALAFHREAMLISGNGKTKSNAGSTATALVLQEPSGRFLNKILLYTGFPIVEEKAGRRYALDIIHGLRKMDTVKVEAQQVVKKHGSRTRASDHRTLDLKVSSPNLLNGNSLAGAGVGDAAVANGGSTHVPDIDMTSTLSFGENGEKVLVGWKKQKKGGPAPPPTTKKFLAVTNSVEGNSSSTLTTSSGTSSSSTLPVPVKRPARVTKKGPDGPPRRNGRPNLFPDIFPIHEDQVAEEQPPTSNNTAKRRKIGVLDVEGLSLSDSDDEILLDLTTVRQESKGSSGTSAKDPFPGGTTVSYNPQYNIEQEQEDEDLARGPADPDDPASVIASLNNNPIGVIDLSSDDEEDVDISGRVQASGPQAAEEDVNISGRVQQPRGPNAGGGHQTNLQGNVTRTDHDRVGRGISCLTTPVNLTVVNKGHGKPDHDKEDDDIIVISDSDIYDGEEVP
ncbi:unnamed protein product [Amoebophrya sp. A25]|nr:unnamed protein product [Amoebophrya sp. A25]|eukprot:GSA25T00007355001.1